MNYFPDMHRSVQHSGFPVNDIRIFQLKATVLSEELHTILSIYTFILLDDSASQW